MPLSSSPLSSFLPSLLLPGRRRGHATLYPSTICDRLAYLCAFLLASTLLPLPRLSLGRFEGPHRGAVAMPLLSISSAVTAYAAKSMLLSAVVVAAGC